MREEQQAQAARRRAEEEARREQQRQEDARNQYKRKTDADRRSAEAAAKYRQEQADAANERLRKLEREERERAKQRWEEMKRSRQQDADRRSAEAAARYQQQRAAAAAAAERLRKLIEEEKNREKERQDGIRRTKQKEANLRSAAAAARCQQMRAAAAKERLRHLQQEELKRKNGKSADGPPNIPEAERTHTGTAPERPQEQAEPTDEGIHWNGYMWMRKGSPEHLGHKKAMLRAFYEGQQQNCLQHSNSSRWPHEHKVDWIRSRFNDNVRPWAEESRQIGGLPSPNCKRIRLLLKGCMLWMERLEKLAISPQLRKDTDMDDLLETLYRKEEFHFPEVLSERARLLHARWEIIEWGERTSYLDEF